MKKVNKKSRVLEICALAVILGGTAVIGILKDISCIGALYLIDVGIFIICTQIIIPRIQAKKEQLSRNKNGGK